LHPLDIKHIHSLSSCFFLLSYITQVQVQVKHDQVQEKSLLASSQLISGAASLVQMRKLLSCLTIICLHLYWLKCWHDPGWPRYCPQKGYWH